MVYNIVVLGDSIQWGQGLRESDKMYTKVKNYARKKYKTTARVHNFAHSGAIIGWNKSMTSKKKHGEVPSNYPTIKKQLAEAANKFRNKNAVNLVLMDGGINDVNFRNIINPLKKDKALKKRFWNYTYRDLKKLVKEVARTFPAAKIIVTGYYRIISKHTSIWPVAALAGAIGLALGGPITGILAAGTIKLAKKEMISQSNLWARDSKFHMKAAIREANGDLGTRRIKFVVPTFRAKNALFASESWLFGLSGKNPKDPQKRLRARQCKKYKQNNYSCKLASVGHPNKKGTTEYMKKILPLV